MQRYFYISEVIFNQSKIKVEKIRGYFTDIGHSLFFPLQEISREVAITLMCEGNVLFLYDGCYKQIFIEPKGKHITPLDKWKEDFLKEIKKEFGDKLLRFGDSSGYRLIGIPVLQ